MELSKVIENRRSIRKYKSTPVSRENLLKILEAARIAPSASNKQPWHFVVVENKETIEKLAKSPWAATAPVMIVGLADLDGSPTWCHNDLGIAIEHMVLAAWDLGLGTCWMGQSNREDLVKEVLGITDRYKPVALITIGEADEAPPAKSRKSIDEIVSWERFGSS